MKFELQNVDTNYKVVIDEFKGEGKNLECFFH